MLSLHQIDLLFFEQFEFILVLNNVCVPLLNILFFTLLLYTFLFIYSNSYYLNYKFSYLMLVIYWMFLGFIWFIFLVKIYVNHRFYEVDLTIKTIQLFELNLHREFNILGDVLVLLCITTLLVSWVFLSERYIYLSKYGTIYFFIFIIFTLNMVYARNLLIMFIFFEFIFLPSLFFVYLLGYAKKVEKTIKYLLIWTLTGSFLVLVTISYLYLITTTLDFDFLCFIRLTFLEKNMIYILFFLGFGIKIPLWPFHYWLTKVHVEAPTGFSIFLSGYLVKTALFCLIYFITLFKTYFLSYISIAWILWGSIDASIRMWSATDIKRLIAFATIQEMNLILLFVFLTTNTFSKIFNAFIMVHGLLSALFFFLVDQVQKRYQTRNLTSLSGLAYKITFLPIFIWFGILIFRGFPLFSKFLIEWEVLSLLYDNYSYLGIIIFFLISIFGVLGFCRIWFIVLYGQPSKNLVNSIDMLKLDKVIALTLITLLTIIANLLFLF